MKEISEETKAKIKELWEGGKSIGEICYELNLTRPTVWSNTIWQEFRDTPKEIEGGN